MKLRILYEGKQTTAVQYMQELGRRIQLVEDELQPVEEAVFAWEGVPYERDRPIYMMYLKRDPRTGKHSLKTEWPLSSRSMGVRGPEGRNITIQPIEEVMPDSKLSPNNPNIKNWLELYDELQYWNDKQSELMYATEFGEHDFPLYIDDHGNMVHDKMQQVIANRDEFPGLS